MRARMRVLLPTTCTKTTSFAYIVLLFSKQRSHTIYNFVLRRSIRQTDGEPVRLEPR